MYAVLLKENKILREEIAKLRERVKNCKCDISYVVEPEIIPEPKPYEIIHEEPLAPEPPEVIQEIIPEPEIPEPEIPEIIPEPKILETIHVTIVEDELLAIDNKSKTKYKCIRCGFRYKPNCPYCKNNV
jgi:rubrerythrin